MLKGSFIMQLVWHNKLTLYTHFRPLFAYCQWGKTKPLCICLFWPNLSGQRKQKNIWQQHSELKAWQWKPLYCHLPESGGPRPNFIICMDKQITVNWSYWHHIDTKSGPSAPLNFFLATTFFVWKYPHIDDLGLNSATYWEMTKWPLVCHVIQMSCPWQIWVSGHIRKSF